MENGQIELSIVVPFYGVEQFIGECLESIYHQDLDEERYEVICVNDCTPDNSEQIVSRFMKDHNNLKLFRHDTNKKLGAARNTGLKAANGEYVWFVDSDDYIQNNCLSEIIGICKKDSLDIFHWSIKDNQDNWMNRFEDSAVITGINDLLDGSKDMTFPWNRLYRREFLLKYGLWFNDLWGGDVIHTIKALNNASRIRNSSKCYYYYRTDNMSSDMRSPATANKVVSFCYVLGKALFESSSELSPKLLPVIDECTRWRLNNSFKPILKMPLSEKRLFYTQMKKDVELRGFVLSMADNKVVFALKWPALVYLLHPICWFLRVVKR